MGRKALNRLTGPDMTKLLLNTALVTEPANWHSTIYYFSLPQSRVDLSLKLRNGFAYLKNSLQVSIREKSLSNVFATALCYKRTSSFSGWPELLSLSNGGIQTASVSFISIAASENLSSGVSEYETGCTSFGLKHCSTSYRSLQGLGPF